MGHPALVSSQVAQYNTNNQISDGLHTYDAAGDVTVDATTGNQYLYDGEGRLCAVESTPVAGYTTMTGYLYDAAGNRVAKGTITTMSCDPATSGLQITESYVLDEGGKELTMLDGNNNWQRTNVYGNGALLATYDANGLHFHLTDPLGTRRVQTNASGTPELDCENLPFGDQQSCYPDPNAPSTADNATPLFFTGKERDAESGNDYFGARYYASSMGRFLSPDPSGLYFADQTNPQSFNLYAYAVNNPLKFVDPSGLWHCVWDSATGDQDDKPEDGGATEQECDDQGGGWTIDPGDDPGDSSETLQMQSEHPGDGGSSGDSTVMGTLCGMVPSAGVQAISGATGGLGGPTGSLELVTNYRTGQVSGFASGGLSFGWNGGATGALSYGAVWGLKGDNSNYAGGFTSVTGSGSFPGTPFGLQATASASSGGVTGSPKPDGQIKSLTVGVNASLISPRYSVSGAATNYSAPKQLGKWWTLFMNPLNIPMIIDNQVCNALGY